HMKDINQLLHLHILHIQGCFANVSNQIYEIFQLLPQKLQVGVFSATMPFKVLEIARKFMKEPVRILVNRDELPLEAHEVDVEEVSLVINYDLLAHLENYAHRFGRRGVARKKDVAINIVTDEDMILLQDIEKVYNVVIEELPSNVEDWHASLSEYLYIV
ncbi:hypothetical protein GOP47_0023836, partial [Adiantum capillus-veneris]